MNKRRCDNSSSSARSLAHAPGFPSSSPIPVVVVVAAFLCASLACLITKVRPSDDGGWRKVRCASALHVTPSYGHACTVRPASASGLGWRGLARARVRASRPDVRCPDPPCQVPPSTAQQRNPSPTSVCRSLSPCPCLKHARFLFCSFPGLSCGLLEAFLGRYIKKRKESNRINILLFAFAARTETKITYINTQITTRAGRHREAAIQETREREGGKEEGYVPFNM